MTMRMVKGMAAAMAFCLAGIPAAALAADGKTAPCPRVGDTLAARPSAPVVAAPDTGSRIPQLAAPQAGGTPLKLTPKLLPPAGGGAGETAYVLDPESGEVTFGDGLQGRRLPSGSGDVGTAYRSGGGATGQTTEYPCK